MTTAIFKKDTVEKAQVAVEEAIDVYNWAVSALSLEIETNLLIYNADKQKEDVIRSILGGEDDKTHADINAKRVKDTNNWFIDTETFKDWVDGDNLLLTCSGNRTRYSHRLLTRV